MTSEKEHGDQCLPSVGPNQYSLELHLSLQEEKKNSLSSVNLPLACHHFDIIYPQEPC